MGSGCSYSHGGEPGGEVKEVCMWLGVRHTHKEALSIFSRELAPAGTGMGEWPCLVLVGTCTCMCVRDGARQHVSLVPRPYMYVHFLYMYVYNS